MSTGVKIEFQMFLGQNRHFCQNRVYWVYTGQTLLAKIKIEF